MYICICTITLNLPQNCAISLPPLHHCTIPMTQLLYHHSSTTPFLFYQQFTPTPRLCHSYTTIPMPPLPHCTTLILPALYPHSNSIPFLYHCHIKSIPSPTLFPPFLFSQNFTSTSPLHHSCSTSNFHPLQNYVILIPPFLYLISPTILLLF
jgi:hypothetical protein